MLPEVSVVIPARCSADALRPTLDALERQTLERSRFEIVVIEDASDPPMGSYAARNAGIARATAGVLAFTDADGKPLRRSQPRQAFDYLTFVLECENPIPQPSAFIRRRVVEETGPLDPTLRYFMDWDYWLRAGLRHPIAYVTSRELHDFYAVSGIPHAVVIDRQGKVRLFRIGSGDKNAADLKQAIEECLAESASSQ